MIYRIVGLMSGTSLDGLDLAFCEFNSINFSDFKIIKAITLEYPDDLSNKLRNSVNLNAFDYIELHKIYGKFLGLAVKDFLSGQKADFVASHGHTSIHLPHKNVNFQLGDGATIAAFAQLPVVCDFRSLDIALNGQGAPLVPAGEIALFSEFDSLINIGGFANITMNQNSVEAFDICPANYALNYFSRKLDKKFDEDGKIGRSGIVNNILLDKLNEIEYYSKPNPKSLSDHWFFDSFLPIINHFEINVKDILRTIYEHVSFQIAKILNAKSAKKVLITGGGAFNTFLIELIQSKTTANITIPEKIIVEYKEALIFAFLGLLRWLEIPNCLSSVTGSKHDNIGGAIYYYK